VIYNNRKTSKHLDLKPNLADIYSHIFFRDWCWGFLLSFMISLSGHSSLPQIKNCEAKTKSSEGRHYFFPVFNNVRPLIKETF